VFALAALVVWLEGSTSPGGSSAPGDSGRSGAALTSSGDPSVSVKVVLPRVARAGPAASAPSPPPALPWPKTGEAAVDVPAVGFRAQSGHERPVPVASMTKVMTAYVVLEDHPLALGQQGPRITVTQADASQFGTDTVTDQANVLLKQGEVLTEYQMLEGLLVHSANDLAYALASWDAGSVPAFVAKMNSVAAGLGMHDTHFADASGFSPSSVSTAADLLRVGAVAMADPVFEQIVSMPAVTLPLAGTVGSYTPMLGATGVVGVKSGFTTAAGGGDLLAYRTTVGGHTLLSLAAVTSQEGWTVLGFAGREALALAKAASARVLSMTAAPKGTVVARLTSGTRSVAVRTASAASVLVLPGGSIHQAVHLRALHAGARRGTEVGTATFVFAGQVVSVPVRLAGRLP
jgi:D-alanyl-D-alanine carboxypeptidase (penicillin-binding protein 5/6)